MTSIITDIHSNPEDEHMKRQKELFQIVNNITSQIIDKVSESITLVVDTVECEETEKGFINQFSLNSIALSLLNATLISVENISDKEEGDRFILATKEKIKEMWKLHTGEEF